MSYDPFIRSLSHNNDIDKASKWLLRFPTFGRHQSSPKERSRSFFTAQVASSQFTNKWEPSFSFVLFPEIESNIKTWKHSVTWQLLFNRGSRRLREVVLRVKGLSKLTRLHPLFTFEAFEVTRGTKPLVNQTCDWYSRGPPGDSGLRAIGLQSPSVRKRKRTSWRVRSRSQNGGQL